MTGVIVGGGSPCQGISKLNADRIHLQEPPRGCFTSTSNRRCGKRDEGMVENVVGDEEDI